MSADLVPAFAAGRRHRVDGSIGNWIPTRTAAVLAWITLATSFVVLGGGSLELGDWESRLGMAAGEQIGPFGQVYGGWEPGLWPLQILPSSVWAWAEGGRPTVASVRWPSVIAALLVGLLLARRTGATFGTRAGVFFTACFFGSLALIDRSDSIGIPWISGLAVIAALDRILAKGSDWIAGLWASAAFLAGGWPPVLMILLPIVIVGRSGASISWRLLAPIAIAFFAWSGWALSLEQTAAWGAALARPLTEGPRPWLIRSVFLAGLPWTPFIGLIVAKSVRDGWTDEGRGLVRSWLQVAAVALLAGTLIPGLGSAALLPAFAGIAIATSACLDRVWNGGLGRAIRWTTVLMCLTLVLIWAAIMVPLGGYLAAAISYYRQLSLLLVALSIILTCATVEAVRKRDVRWCLGAIVALSVMLKVAHWGIYTPERNYRLGQGPWGRAIGQWVLPNWPIYTLHAWPADLSFATEHPIRLLSDPVVLEFKCRVRPAYVLLLATEFEHWPKEAPPLIVVRRFEDERGDERVLARTKGDLGLRRGPDAE
jgi:hypothetical protein